MNNHQKGKAFERWDRDGVAQHKNLMHEIAMKKQISMYQREEKILERELREISKVKETLLQIRAPLRRRVQAATLEKDFVESSGPEKNLRKASVATRKTSVVSSGAQQSCTNKQDPDGTSGLKLQTFSGRTSLQAKHDSVTPSPNMRQRKISVNTPQGMSGGTRFAQRKISAPAFFARRSPVSEDSSKNGFLPVIKTPNPPPEISSPSVKRKSPLLDRPLSAAKTNEVDFHTRSPATSTLMVPSRVDTSLCRARSVPLELPSYPMSTARGRRQSEADEVATLTMEETLRIKGKFRQIGHSCIATALLKGLKQKGQLSSEAIHNMHKPICLGEGSETKTEDNKGTDESASESKENDGEEEAMKQGHGRQTFRNLARKTINVNRMLSVHNSARRRTKSDPSETDKNSAATTAYSRPKTVASSTRKHSDKGLGQEKADNSVQPKDFRANGAGQRRRDSVTEVQQDTNTQDGNESEHNSQQMYKKQSGDVDPLRPLMNPRTAHARRRKNTLTGDMMADLIEKAHNASGDAKPQKLHPDEQTTGNKCVRFATDAWS